MTYNVADTCLTHPVNFNIENESEACHPCVYSWELKGPNTANHMGLNFEVQAPLFEINWYNKSIILSALRSYSQIGLPTLDLGRNTLTSLASFSPSHPGPTVLFPVGHLNQLGSLGEHCKLSQWGLGQSCSQIMISCISEPRSSSGGQQFLCIFIRINFNFCAVVIV